MDPVINIEEKIGKTVGRRRPTDVVRYSARMQKTVGELAKTFGVRMQRRGVFRFRTHEEADEWMNQRQLLESQGITPPMD